MPQFVVGFSGGSRGTSTRRLLDRYFPKTLSTLPVIIASTPMLNKKSEPCPEVACHATIEMPVSRHAQATIRTRSMPFMPLILPDSGRESRPKVALVLDLIGRLGLARRLYYFEACRVFASFKAIRYAAGMVWVTAALLGESTLSKEETEKAAAVLGLEPLSYRTA